MENRGGGGSEQKYRNKWRRNSLIPYRGQNNVFPDHDNRSHRVHVEPQQIPVQQNEELAYGPLLNLDQYSRETRQKRAYRSTKMAELYELETLGRKIGLISGPKTAGRKPNS